MHMVLHRPNPVVAAPQSSPSQPSGGEPGPLITLATPLLLLMIQLRRQARPAEETRLYLHVSNEIQALDPQLVHQGYDPQTIHGFRYLLCCVLDEAVMSQSWGSQGCWSSHSLLTRFHSESWGGEQFFVRLQRLMTQPEMHMELLQFAHLCLCLGYEGRYRIQPQGEVALRRLQTQLHQLIYPELSPRHAATLHLTPQPQPMVSSEQQPLPLMLYGLGLFLLLMLVFLCFHQSLAQQSAQILRLLLPPLH